ncbi:MAG: alpha/beta fold hydrolase [Candidatus Eremiobacteraeota bacterium]|nr:alpha/beta fold hydrolase [Candidatus Eremiobacteraeota bacterium]
MRFALPALAVLLSAACSGAARDLMPWSSSRESVSSTQERGASLSTIAQRPAPRQILPWRLRPVPSGETAGEGVEGASIVVGTQRLQRCKLVVPGYCGYLTVPLNWLDANDGNIVIRYQWLPARNGRSAHTIVAEEGGPGYSTTGTGYEYRTLFYPLLRDHNLLMMDQRGTGGSEPIDCPALQPYGGTGTSSVPFNAAVALCGKQLNHTYRDAFGRYVHASDLFGTSQAVRDLSAILVALNQGSVDFYGDSYGSFFGQVFASRYPQLLRSLVLDSTYPTIHQDPFDRAGQAEIRFGFSAVCRRSAVCSADTTGSPLVRLAHLDASLDADPLKGIALTPEGRQVPTTMKGPDIWTLLSSAGDDYGPYRNIDAATRAYLGRGDPVPLLRLDNWTTYGPTFTGYGYREFSEGMYIADICTVYKQPFDVYSTLPERFAEYARQVAALPASFGYPLLNSDVFASPAEWYNNCIDWPAPTIVDPIITKPAPIVPPTLPVLVLSGDLDETTSPGDNRQAAAALGPSVFFVDLPNEIHASALLDPFDCPSAIVVDFIRADGPVDTSCRRRIPQVPTVGVFPLHLADQPPARAHLGNTATADELRLAAIAVEAAGDAIQAAIYAYDSYKPNCGGGYCGPGLRGGSFRASGNLKRIDLYRYAYSSDTQVSGSVSIAEARWPWAPGIVTVSDLSAHSAAGMRVEISTTYDQRLKDALARIRGLASSGKRIDATIPAP